MTDLSEPEIFWRDHYDYLKDRGYTLRRRYEPDWTPSWEDGRKPEHLCEDFVVPFNAYILDATRRDGTFVALKRVDVNLSSTGLSSTELVVAKFFSSPELAMDPRNHCVPVLDIIVPKEGSNTAFLVMPLLFSTDFAAFQTIGEAVEYFRQIFEGLWFMHHHNVCHGDCKENNIMDDLAPLYDHPPHPLDPWTRRDYRGSTNRSVSRTLRPVNHYLIDFGLSNIYSDGQPRLEIPPWGGDRTVPEHNIPNAPPCDPFPVDVYCLGNIVREGYLDGSELLDLKPKIGFEFMRELVTDMVNSDPKQRPTMAEVVERYDKIVEGLSEWTLRSPVINVGENFGIFRFIAHCVRQLFRIMWRIPAIPKP